MPRGDGTGPMGTGRMAGKGAGYCAGFTAPGYGKPVGFGCGFGGRRGFQRMFHGTDLPGWGRLGYPTYTGAYESAVDEKEFLSQEAESLEIRLEQVKKRLSSFKENAE